MVDCTLGDTPFLDTLTPLSPFHTPPRGLLSCEFGRHGIVVSFGYTLAGRWGETREGVFLGLVLGL